MRSNLVRWALSAALVGGACEAHAWAEDQKTETESARFRYVVPEVGREFDQPAFVALALSAEKPSELVEYRGSARRRQICPDNRPQPAIQLRQTCLAAGNRYTLS